MRKYLRSCSTLLYYGLWIIGFDLLFKTVATFFLIPFSSNLGEISETLNSYKILTASFAAVSFVVLQSSFSLNQRGKSLFHREWISKRLLSIKNALPGLGRGILIATGTTLALLISGHYELLGLLLHYDNVYLFFFQFVFQMFVIFSLVWAEELIFRRQLLAQLNTVFPPLPAILITSVLYCLIKLIQFNPAPSDLVFPFFASTLLGISFFSKKTIWWGTGLMTGILIVFNPVLGLPLFGHDFPGIFLIKTHAIDPTSHDWMTHTFPRLLTGGERGPLSSLALQLVMVGYLIIIFPLRKNLLFNQESKS